MAQGKSAMMISRPWDWPSLIKSGIDLGVTLVHGINGKLGKAFMGVQVDLSQSLLAESRPHKRIPGQKGLSASDHVTPIGSARWPLRSGATLEDAQREMLKGRQ
jgi:hypothetical protein